MSKIEWTGETWNPILGCDKVSPGCKNCYAIKTAWIRMHNPKMAERYAGAVEKTAGGQLNWTGKVNMVNEALLKPLKTKKPTTFFVNSMSDLFHESVPFYYIDMIFCIMRVAKQHTFQILTKRDKRMAEYFSSDRPKLLDDAYFKMMMVDDTLPSWVNLIQNNEVEGWPLENVWIGVSVENQETANERIPNLLQVPAAVRFLSCEPLLGEVDLQKYLYRPVFNGAPSDIEINDQLHWVICGGESGPNSRPMHPDWARQLRDQCKGACVPFFFKQWGNWIPMIGHVNGLKVREQKFTFPNGTIMGYTQKQSAGRLLDGQLYDEFPIVNK